jgi:hypothetical protein
VTNIGFCRAKGNPVRSFADRSANQVAARRLELGPRAVGYARPRKRKRPRQNGRAFRLRRSATGHLLPS